MSTVFVTGTTNVLDAGRSHGMRRVVALSTGTFLDLTAPAIAALDRRVAGARYWLTGRPEDEISIAASCNRACELAGVAHRVQDLDHRTASEEITAAFGPTLMAIAGAAANVDRPPRSTINPTSEQLGYRAMSLEDGLGLRSVAPRARSPLIRTRQPATLNGAVAPVRAQLGSVKIRRDCKSRFL